jgi:hypothetical protein
MKTIIYISALLALLCGQAIAQACTEANQLSDCTDVNLPLCIGGVCSPCTSGSASACDNRYYGTPVCTDVGACVACAEGAQCNFDPNRPICLTGPDYIGCYECTNTTMECFNATMGAAPFCYNDGHCGGCASDYDCLVLMRSNAFTCNSDGVCEVPVVGPYMIATFVIIGFVILVFIIVISVVASKNKKNRQKRKNREAAKSDRKQEMLPLTSRAEQQPASDHAPRKSVDKPRAVTKEGDKENLMTGAALVPKEKKDSSKSSSSSASSDSSSTSESPAPKPAVPAAVVAPVATTDAKEHSASSSVSGRSRSSSASSSSSESTDEKKESESSSGSSVTSSSH